MHILVRVHLQHLLAEPEQVAESQIRFHILLEYGGQFPDSGHILHLETFFRHRRQKRLLQLDAAGIPHAVPAVDAVGVVLPPAHHLHGVVPGQAAHARGLVDMQILRRVVVVHVIGDIESHAPYGVHQPAHGVPLYQHIVVRRHAGQHADLLFQGVHAHAAVDGVELFRAPLHIDHGVPGHAHGVDGAVLGVDHGQQHGVRPVADGVFSAREESVHALFPARGDGRLFPHLLRLRGL